MEVNLGINTSTGNLLNPKELDSLRLDPTFCHFGPRGPGSHAEIHWSKSAKLPKKWLKVESKCAQVAQGQITRFANEKNSTLQISMELKCNSAGCIWLKNDIIGANAK